MHDARLSCLQSRYPTTLCVGLLFSFLSTGIFKTLIPDGFFTGYLSEVFCLVCSVNITRWLCTHRVGSMNTASSPSQFVRFARVFIKTIYIYIYLCSWTQISQNNTSKDLFLHSRKNGRLNVLSLSKMRGYTLNLKTRKSIVKRNQILVIKP